MPRPDTDAFQDEPTAPYLVVPRARVMIVEDDPWFRALLTRRLERDGYDVYEAATGDEALVALRFIHELSWPTDALELIILDNQLPGTSGLQVLERLRAAANTTPALLVTAFPDSTTIDAAGRFGAAVLCKPFPLDTLCDAAIDAILAASGARS